MTENFDAKVKVKDELMTGLIFGIEARPALAIILGFTGYSHHVIQIL